MVDKAIQLGCNAPSACNRQPFQFRIFDDPELVQQIAATPMGTRGFKENIPCIAVLVGKHRNYFSERDRHLIYIDGSLASMGFLFGLESQGLSSCCINWPEIYTRDQSLAKIIKLEPDERPVMLIAIGFPDPSGKVAFSAKKPLELIRKYNFE